MMPGQHHGGDEEFEGSYGEEGEGMEDMDEDTLMLMELV